MSDEIIALLEDLLQGRAVDQRSQVYEQAGVMDFRHNSRLLPAGLAALAAARARKRKP